MELDSVLAIIDAFNREGVRYKVFGGMATNLHGVPRATEDADFLFDPLPENVARMRRALRSMWDDPHLDDVGDNDMRCDYPLVTYRAPNSSFCINLVAALPYDAFESTILDVRGVPVQIVAPYGLNQMKRDSLRYKDTIDAIHLRERFDFPE